MSDRTWRKVGSLSGIGFVLLLVLAYILGPNDPPPLDGGATGIAGFVSQNGDDINVSSALYAAALVLFAFFIGAIAANNRAGDREGRLSAAGHAGGIAALISGALSVGFAVASSAAIDTGYPGSEALWIMSCISFLGVLLGIAVLALATGKIALDGRAVLPGWLGLGSVVVAVFLGAVAIIALVTREGAFSPYDGEMVRIAFLVAALYAAALSWSLYDKVR